MGVDGVELLSLGGLLVLHEVEGKTWVRVAGLQVVFVESVAHDVLEDDFLVLRGQPYIHEKRLVGLHGVQHEAPNMLVHFEGKSLLHSALDAFHCWSHLVVLKADEDPSQALIGKHVELQTDVGHRLDLVELPDSSLKHANLDEVGQKVVGIQIYNDTTVITKQVNLHCTAVLNMAMSRFSLSIRLPLFASLKRRVCTEMASLTSF